MVLGANGQDGSYLVDCLLRKGHSVIGVGRQPSPLYQIHDDRFQYIGLDVSDPKNMDRRIILVSLRFRVPCRGDPWFFWIRVRSGLAKYDGGERRFCFRRA